VVETVINFQGRDKFVQYLKEDLEFYELLKRAVFGETITLEDYVG
jgi:hypothetical protein